MADNSENNKRIIKNTIVLYFRMMVTMAIGLFTSRVILNTLGIEDYGINNVVAGVVAMFAFLSNSVSSAISRFLTFELGKGYSEKLRAIYSTSVNIMVVVAVFMFVLIEIIGVWFLNTQLEIPDDRMYAANWVMQFAILTFVINIINIPYNSVIIAHEKMDIFAYFTLFDVLMKLVIVYVLYVSPFDKLITFSALILGVSVLMRIGYGVYCSHSFQECKYQFVLDKTLLKEIGGFAGWNMFGSAAFIFNTQGINILTNLFFGVTLNAARGIATQVEGIIRQFVNNFTTALNPQITKSYASKNIDYMNILVCRGAKYSYLLMLFFAIPICFEADIMLKLWLKTVPEYTAIFVRLTLIGTMMDLLGNSMANACWATGKVKVYYLYVATFGCLPFFLSWVAFKQGCEPYWSYIAFIVVYLLLVFLKMFLLKNLMNFPYKMFFKEVFCRIVPVTVIAIILPGIVWFFMSESVVRFLVVGSLSVISTFISVYLLGLESSERDFVLSKISLKVKKFK